MINYDKLPERIDIDMNGNVYVQKLPMENHLRLLCPYESDRPVTCNVRCARCSIMLEGIEEMTCWKVTCCGTTYRAKQLYRQPYSSTTNPPYQEVPKRYTPSK